MIAIDLARELSRAGLRWHPRTGDRFTIDQPELVGEIFTLSEMTVEAHTYPTGTVLGFNGTTEWALDSVSLAETLWLPREDQLRSLLGATFRSLSAEDGVFRVRTDPPRTPAEEFVAAEAADAYARALLSLIRRAA
ncbi:pilus assembly protein CpaE [Georgenia sp. 10Sc9-8]|uniref:Pilus assembly protein CpaE n=1 Tax=Georgenia halotolerans TaxID=3028317 RepID=A0ABT5TXQ2_9MICO|nr:pilus assembly protein CpaE [Georgenia halotolerans]